MLQLQEKTNVLALCAENKGAAMKDRSNDENVLFDVTTAAVLSRSSES